MIEDRLRQLNSTHINSDGNCVLYVMSRDQRLQDNHALLLAQRQALDLQLPLVIAFNFLKPPNRSREHFQFMIKGLQELAATAQTYNITTLFYAENTDAFLHKIIELSPAAVYFDFSPLHGPTNLRKKVAIQLDIACYEVDTHNIIPAWIASDHQEFAAHTFRPKVHKLLATYLVAPPKLTRHPYKMDKVKHTKSLLDLGNQILPEIHQCGISVTMKPGELAAHNHLKEFIASRLKTFTQQRNDPSKDGLSNLSPYLHFGHISSLRVALDVLNSAKIKPLLFSEARMPSTGDAPSVSDGMNVLFEEMIIRKELSDNFCLYAKSYTNFSSVPTWALTTLDTHKADKREFVYKRKQWEQAQTHDPAWNAAQNQLRQTGKMHGYMRMYWAKKMLEWSRSPEQALADCIYLNDKYSIDGGDPNGYVGIMWSIAGLHDRPWTERPVFGKIRYMNYGGLKRKFNIESYIQTWTHQTKII